MGTLVQAVPVSCIEHMLDMQIRSSAVLPERGDRGETHTVMQQRWPPSRSTRIRGSGSACQSGPSSSRWGLYTTDVIH